MQDLPGSPQFRRGRANPIDIREMRRMEEQASRVDKINASGDIGILSHTGELALFDQKPMKLTIRLTAAYSSPFVGYYAWKAMILDESGDWVEDTQIHGGDLGSIPARERNNRGDIPVGGVGVGKVVDAELASNGEMLEFSYDDPGEAELHAGNTTIPPTTSFLFSLLQALNSSGIYVDNPSAGTARLQLLTATPTQSGAVITSAQEWAGNKATQGMFRSVSGFAFYDVGSGVDTGGGVFPSTPLRTDLMTGLSSNRQGGLYVQENNIETILRLFGANSTSGLSKYLEIVTTYGIVEPDHIKSQNGFDAELQAGGHFIIHGPGPSSPHFGVNIAGTPHTGVTGTRGDGLATHGGVVTALGTASSGDLTLTIPGPTTMVGNAFEYIAGAGIAITSPGANQIKWEVTGITGVTDGDKGDITISASGATYTIDPNAVTNSKLADMSEGRIKGRPDGAGTGDPQDLTALEVVAILNLALPNATNRYHSTTGNSVTWGASGTWVALNTNTTVTLTAGRWIVLGFYRGYVQWSAGADGRISMRVRDTTAGANVTSSPAAIFEGVANVLRVNSQVQFALYTSTGSNVLRIEVMPEGGTTWTAREVTDAAILAIKLHD